MTTTEADIVALERDIAARIAKAPDEAALEGERVAALGKKGRVSELMKGLGAMSPEERKVMGPALNGLKDRVSEALAARRAILKEQDLVRRLAAEAVDVTLPARPAPLETGRIRPVSQVIDEITAIFADLGFIIAEGPDIETDYDNFTALNFPPGHPAREMHDTFFRRRRRRRAHGSQDPHLAGANPRHGGDATADPCGRARPYLPLRFRPDPHPHVPSDRGAGHRPDQPYRPSEMGSGRVLPCLLRGEAGADAFSP